MDLLRLVAAFSSKLNILEIVFVATLTSALLSCRSHSQSVQAADVMQNRLGLFNAEEFDSNLYSVMISTEPVMATTATDVGGGDNTASKMVKESQDVDDREDEASKETEKEEKVQKIGSFIQRGVVTLSMGHSQVCQVRVLNIWHSNLTHNLFSTQNLT